LKSDAKLRFFETGGGGAFSVRPGDVAEKCIGSVWIVPEGWDIFGMVRPSHADWILDGGVARVSPWAILVLSLLERWVGPGMWLCFPRSPKARDPSTPLRAGSGAPIFRA